MLPRWCLLLWVGLIPGALLARPTPIGAEERPLRAPVQGEARVRSRATAGPAFQHYGPSATLAIGIQDVGGARLTVAQDRKHPVVSWSLDGKAMRQRLTRVAGHRLALQKKPPRTLLVFPDRLGTWHFVPGEALRFEVRNVAFEVLDRDHDGVYFEPGDDALRRVGDAHAVPLRTLHVVEDWTLRVIGFDADRERLTYEVAPISLDATDEERAVLRTVNRERERTGLLGAVSLAEYAEPLRSHSRWMAHHAKVQHSEIPGTELYTVAGNAAGEASVILTHSQHVHIATYIDLDSPIHGHVLCMPEFVRTGVGAVQAKGGVIYGGIWTMEQGGFKHARLDCARFPAVWPPHMATDVPRSWTSEGEDPRPPDDRGTEQGYPIKVYLSPGMQETVPLTDLDVALFAQGAEDKPLDCYVIAPDRPLGHPGSPFLHHLLGTLKPIFVLPRTILEKDTWYVLDLSWKVDGRPCAHRSAFRTGTQRGQYRDLPVGGRRSGR